MFHSEQQFVVDGSSSELLEATLMLAGKFEKSVTKVTGYSIVDGVMKLYNHTPSTPVNIGMIPLPAPVSLQAIVSIIWSWLKSSEAKQQFTETHPAMDIDGSVEVGWKISVSNRWDDLFCPVQITHTWLYYAK